MLHYVYYIYIYIYITGQTSHVKPPGKQEQLHIGVPKAGKALKNHMVLYLAKATRFRNLTDAQRWATSRSAVRKGWVLHS